MPKPTWEVLSYDSPGEREKWRALCGLFRDIDIQYFPEYAYLFQLNGDGQAHCFVYRQSDDGLVLYPFLKRRINAIPIFSDLPDDLCDITVPYGYGGYLRSGDGVDMAAFYAAFEAYCRQNQVVSEFVRFHPLLANQQYAPPAVPVQKWNDTVVMDLAQSEAALWKSLAPTCRNKVRKAKRAGVRLVMDEACEQLESFHALYSATMNRLEAAPYYLFPLRWFKSLIDLLPNHVVLANAVVGDDLIASSVFLFCGRHMHYFLSGSDAERHSLCPNNLLLYEAALWGKRRGYTRLHLGGGQLPNDSLFQFKSSFSPLGAPFFIGKKVHDASTYAMLLDRQDAGTVRELYNLHPFPGYRASRQQFQTSGVSGMNDTIIIGASGHARVCLDVLLAQGYHIKGFYDDNPYLSSSSIHGYPVLGNIGTLLDAQETTAFDYFVAIGNNEHRQSIMTRLSERYGRVAINAIHPSAVISSRSRFGHGNFIAQGVIVNTDTVIGNGVIINTGATVDHDNRLYDFAQISPGCNLAGNVEVGQGAFLGIGAVVIPGKTIGAFAVVGAGAVVTGNLPAHCTAVGVPARVIRQGSKIEK